MMKQQENIFRPLLLPTAASSSLGLWHHQTQHLWTRVNTLVELQGLETCFEIHEDLNVGGPNKMADAQSFIELAGGAKGQIKL